MGKTISDAEAEVFRGLDSIHAACSIGPEMAGMYLGSDPTLLQTFYEPVVRVPSSSFYLEYGLTDMAGRVCIYHPVQLSVHDSAVVHTVCTHHWEHRDLETLREGSIRIGHPGGSDDPSRLSTRGVQHPSRRAINGAKSRNSDPGAGHQFRRF